jgi:hypothetical protein
MIEVNAITFGGICVLAAMGLIRAVIDLIRRPEASEGNWTKSKLPEAPENMEWVLVKKTDLKR